MVYHTQNYCDFRLLPTSGILGTTRRDVSETGCVYGLRCLAPLRTETYPLSETLCFLVPRIPDDGTVQKSIRPNSDHVFHVVKKVY
jgi:hypothetical protein